MAPERLAEARDAMLEELTRCHEAPPSSDELARATAMLAGQAEIARQSAGHFAAEIVEAWLQGGGLDELEAPGAPYRRVTADEVLAVAAEGFAPDSRAEGVLEAIPVG
jgi:hypothetical protein